MQTGRWILIVALGALAVALLTLAFKDTETEPAPAPTIAVEPRKVESDPVDAGLEAAPSVTEAAVSRKVVAEPLPVSVGKPGYSEWLTGFRGRIVDGQAAPVAAVEVTIYRLAFDSVLVAGQDLFAEQASWTMDIRGGEAVTRRDGTFEILGVFPEGFYVLRARGDGGEQLHEFLPCRPDAGQVKDLGDIVMAACGEIAGRIVDEDGGPVAGALVRAADLPAEVFVLFPFERVNPDCSIAVRSEFGSSGVMTMPHWARQLWNDLPIPMTTSAADGSFRLQGVVPGTNMLMVTKDGHETFAKSGVRVGPDEVVSLDSIELGLGEEIFGRVVDAAGKPVTGVEVLAGSTSSMAPVDVLRRLDPTDVSGNFSGTGFSGGKATVAFRRSQQDPWTVLEPAPVLSDFEIVLPGSHTLQVRVVTDQGDPVNEPHLRLLPGDDGRDAVQTANLGLVDAIDLNSRAKRLPDGTLQVEGLPVGDYTVAAMAEGFAWAMETVSITDQDASVNVVLPKADAIEVVVLDPAGEPVEDAKVYCRGSWQAARRMPMMAGRTDKDGSLWIRDMQRQGASFSAQHPRWGTIVSKAGGDEGRVVIQAQWPGSISGVVVRGGEPVVDGSHVVIVQPTDRWLGAPRQPAILRPDAEGRFAMQHVQPGSYGLVAVEMSDRICSPGSLIQFLQSSVTRAASPESAEVVAGQTAEVVVDVDGAPQEQVPTVMIVGRVTVNGAVDQTVELRAWSSKGSADGLPDAGGNYRLEVPVGGEIRLSASKAAKSKQVLLENPALYLAKLKSQQGGSMIELDISIMTTHVAGMVVSDHGVAPVGLKVALHPKRDPGDYWRQPRMVKVDSSGAFRFEDVPNGDYSMSIDAEPDQPYQGRIAKVKVVGGVPVEGLRLAVRRYPLVSGTVDLSVLEAKPSFVSLSMDPSENLNEFSTFKSVQVDPKTGKFEIQGLRPGSYKGRLFCGVIVRGGGQAGTSMSTHDLVIDEPFVVLEQDMTGVVLRAAWPQEQRIR